MRRERTEKWGQEPECDPEKVWRKFPAFHVLTRQTRRPGNRGLQGFFFKVLIFENLRLFCLTTTHFK